ncbi:MAG: non-homologous end-joining DNA ligase [Woeseiaceae bacterium]|nr:non-homologous end-joining DNA ligase [Woeseiaceae bacterium]
MKLELGSHTVETSNDGKVLFPDSGITKGDVIEYYRDIAELMLPHLKGRCLTIQRFPDGLGEDGFFQQNRSDYFPDYVGSKTLAMAGGDKNMEHIVIDHTAGLVYLANQAAITFHGWLSIVDSPQHPDRIVFDLDPSSDDFQSVIDCARLLREVLDVAGLIPFVMTTGSRGLHVIAPLSGEITFDEARDFAKSVAAATAARDRSRFTTRQRKEARHGRLYIDVGRNAYGQTSVLPYSLRAIEGAPVATPLDWDELARSKLSPRSYDIGNLRRRMAQKTDPLADFFRQKRKLAGSRDKLDDWPTSV